MKHIQYILVCAIIALVACAPKTLPPELNSVYTSNEVLIRIQELQRTVIGLYDSNPRGITKESADLIVRFTVSTATIIQSSMDGWKQTVKTSWSALNHQYTPTNSNLQIIWNLTDVMIQSL